MTNKNLRSLLILLSQENPDDRIAKLLAYFYPQLKNLNREGLFEFLHRKIEEADDLNLNEIDESNDDISLEEYKNKDYRIKSFEIASLRGLPSSDENHVPFGIDFKEDGQIKNAIILANNGVGKSSMFAGLEMVYAQEIGEKQLRTKEDNVRKEDYDDYIRRFGATQTPLCTVHTVCGEFGLEKPIFQDDRIRKTFNPSNHFISDYDIYHNGQVKFTGSSVDKNSFHSLVANALGLSEFISFQELVSSIPSYRRGKEKIKYKNLADEKKDKKVSLVNLNEILYRNKEELKILTTGEQSNITQKREEKISRSLGIPLSMSSTPQEIDLTKSNYKKTYTRFLGSERKSKSGIEMDFLNAAKHLINDDEDCPLCQNSNSSLDQIRELVERRLKLLEVAQIEEKSLKVAFNELFSMLSQFFNDFRSILEFVAKEREVIRSKSDLSTLLDLEDSFHTRYAPLLNDEEMLEFIDRMNNKFSFNAGDFEAALEFINGPIIKDLDGILAEVLSLSETREKLYQEWKSKNSTPETSIERKVQLEQEIKVSEAKLKDIQERLEKIEPELKYAQAQRDKVDHVKNDVGAFFPKLEQAISKIVLNSFGPLREIVESVMNDYLTESNLDLTVNIESRGGDDEITRQVIVAQIIDNRTGKTITPDKYFNTFRYKLFTLMISLSLALATRQKYQVNLPLVMDDLFSGSDFVSKNSFSEFLIKVIQLFNKYTPDLPLQFILFTHDDLIFRSAIDAVDFYKAGEFEDVSDKTIIGRIFEAKSSSKNLDDGNHFYNILYKIPNSILID